LIAARRAELATGPAVGYDRESMPGCVRGLVALCLLASVGPARAERHPCLGELDRLGVAYQPVARKGIEVAVEVRGDLGGVVYEGYRKAPLVLDCSLVFSLAHLGRYLAAAGIERATYSSAYQIRNIRGTRRPSKHSFGLAVDVHGFHPATGASLTIVDDYEQGLGDDLDCIGDPLTDAGALLRQLVCQMERSRLFRIILGPDFDAGHYNHLHIEALPWAQREDVAWRVASAGVSRR
jgi:hypothetical protein